MVVLLCHLVSFCFPRNKASSDYVKWFYSDVNYEMRAKIFNIKTITDLYNFEMLLQLLLLRIIFSDIIMQRNNCIELL